MDSGDDISIQYFTGRPSISDQISVMKSTSNDGELLDPSQCCGLRNRMCVVAVGPNSLVKDAKEFSNSAGVDFQGID